MRQGRDSSGRAFANNWYAPTLSHPESQSQAFPEQVKPWQLWPLSVGRKISARYEGPGDGAGVIVSMKISVSVDAFEKISTKAGTFDAFVVTRTDESFASSYRMTVRDWYVPSMGLTVKSTTTDNRGVNRSAEAVVIRH
jgi:hypothetical protein